MNRIAWAQKEKGDLAEAEKTATLALASVGEGEPTAVLGYIKNTLGMIALARSDWARARSYFEQGLETAAALGSDQLKKQVTANIAHVLWKTGEWDEALAMYRRNLEQSQTEGDLWDLAAAYKSIGAIELSRGRFHEAANHFEKSLVVDEKLGSGEGEALAQQALGEALEMIGRWGEAKGILKALFLIKPIRREMAATLAATAFTVEAVSRPSYYRYFPGSLMWRCQTRRIHTARRASAR